MSEPTLRALSLGAGVQSTVVALMAAQGIIPAFDCAIFADTGAEPPSVYRHLEWLTSQLPYPVILASGGNLREEVVQAVWAGPFGRARPPFYILRPDGKRGMLQRQCTRHFKVDVVTAALRDLLHYRKGERIRRGILVEVSIGISTDEVSRAKDARAPWQRNTFPLLDLEISRRDCVAWLDVMGHPTPPKSACTFCPLRSNEGWANLRDTDPEGWEDACQVDEALRSNGDLDFVGGQMFVHRSCTPLRTADLKQPPGRVVDPMAEECEGMCGV